MLKASTMKFGPSKHYCRRIRQRGRHMGADALPAAAKNIPEKKPDISHSVGLQHSLIAPSFCEITDPQS